MEPGNVNNEDAFRRQVEEKEKRMLKAQNEKKRSVWAGFGLFGIIGWSVVVPTLAGAAIGRWLDKAYPQPFSWTLTLLVIGLVSGCFSAWHWVKKEQKEMQRDQEKK